LNTETISREYAELDTWPAERTLEAIINSSRRSVDAVAAALPALTRAAELIGARLAGGGRLIYIGAGTSGRLALQDAAELPPTFGFDRTLVLLAGGSFAGAQAREGAEDHADAALGEVAEADVGEADVMIGIAASGRTPYTVAGIRAARERGALTVGLANNPETPLLLAAEIPVLLDTGPEVLAGSTRLAAGTAQKIALGALSTTALVGLGGAYGNLMVGMKPKNEKLRGRAALIVAEAAGVSEESAAQQLAAADWEIKTAIVMLRAGTDASRARELLAASGGRVRQAITAAG
jgi:N-acetylmuramic acid 6-phosphate etherase